MKTSVQERFNRALIAGFSVFWVLVVLIAYLGFHPYYFTGLIKMPNASIFLGNLLIVAGAWAWWVFSGKPGRTRKVNGLQVYGFFFLIQVFSLVVFNSSYEVLQSPLSLFSFLGTNLLVHASLFLLYTLAYSVGQPLMDLFSGFYAKGSHRILSVALGASLVGLVVFLLGAVHLHTTIVTGLLVLVFLGVRYRQVLELWGQVLVKRRVYKYKNRWLQLPVFILISALAVNGIASIKAFPTGFDGASLYMNTTHLIADYQGLVQGGQAYNWELVLSLGEVLFGQEVFSIGIAHFSFLLVLFAGFRLARLLMNRSWSWAAVSLLALNPSFSYHYIYDEKVDLGFTFVTLSVVLLMIEFWTGAKKTKEASAAPKRLPFNLKAEALMLMLAGWLLGFAFGIKYTGLIGIVAAVAMIGYRFGNYWLSAAILAGFTGALFMLGAGDIAYFPFEGTPPYVPGAISLLTGAVLLVPAFRQQVQLRAFTRSVLLVGGMALLCFSPWVIRNIALTGQVSVNSILKAPPPVPQMSIQSNDAAAKERNPGNGTNTEKSGAVKKEKRLKQDGSMMGYQFDGYWWSAGVFAILAGVFFMLGAGGLAYSPFGYTLPYVPGVIGLLAGAALLISVFRWQLQLRAFTRSVLLVGGMAVLGFSPWAEQNITANEQLSVNDMLRAPFLALPGISPPDNDIDQSKNGTEQDNTNENNGVPEQANRPEKATTPREDGNAKEKLNDNNSKAEPVLSVADQTKREEIRRYLGYESGLPLYASLPYDLTMNNNIQKSQYVDIGFLFLVLFPILLLVGKRNGIVQNLVLMATSLFLLLLGVWTTENQEGFSDLGARLLVNTTPSYESFVNGLWAMLNDTLLSIAAPLDGFFRTLSNMGFAGVFIVILALGGVWGWLLKNRWSGYSPKFKYTLIFTVSFGSLWLLMGSGIVWYGFPMLALLLIYLLYAAVNTGFSFKDIRSWAVGLALISYALLSYSLTFISSLQPAKNAGYIYEEPMLRTFGEGLNRTETLSSFKSYLGEAISYMNQDTSGKVYRVGTFFNYHIDFNDRRVLEDNQLGKFDRAMRSLNDGEKFMDQLKERGFRYVLFDMNTATVDRTPEKSLTRKTQQFLQLLFSSSKARLIYTDNIIKADPGESVPIGRRRVAGRMGVRGETIYRGTYLLFEIN